MGGGKIGKLNKLEIEELQEKLLIVYRFISQKKKFKKFYYEGIDTSEDYNDDSGFLKTLMELDDSEELLRNSIIELVDLKTNQKSKLTPAEFQELMVDQDWNQLYRKYAMKSLEDIGKLDLKSLMELL